MDAKSVKPSVISGGCLCEAVRYNIKISEDEAYPRPTCLCFCTMCRKGSGGLVSAFFMVESPNLEWVSKDSLKEFASREDIRRAFCSQCGSSIYWKSLDREDTTSILAATIDEEFLVDTKKYNLMGACKESYWTEKMIKGLDDVIKTEVMFEQG